MRFLTGTRDVLRVADTCVDQHLLECAQVDGGELAVAAHLLQCGMVKVRLQVLARIGAKAVCVDTDRDAVEVDLLHVSKFVRDVGVDDDALRLGEQLDQSSQATTHELKHRDGDVHPPLVVGELVKQLLLSLDDRDGALVEQPGRDLPQHQSVTRPYVFPGAPNHAARNLSSRREVCHREVGAARPIAINARTSARAE